MCNLEIRVIKIRISRLRSQLCMIWYLVNTYNDIGIIYIVFNEMVKIMTLLF